MPKYLIERHIPGAGQMSAEELREVATKSCEVLHGDVGTGYHWVQSFVTGDRIYCVHIAPDEEAVQEHARQGGFPADHIMEVNAVIDATTAERAPV